MNLLLSIALYEYYDFSMQCSRSIDSPLPEQTKSHDLLSLHDMQNTPRPHPSVGEYSYPLIGGDFYIVCLFRGLWSQMLHLLRSQAGMDETYWETLMVELLVKQIQLS